MKKSPAFLLSMKSRMILTLVAVVAVVAIFGLVQWLGSEDLVEIDFDSEITSLEDLREAKRDLNGKDFGDLDTTELKAIEEELL